MQADDDSMMDLLNIQAAGSDHLELPSLEKHDTLHPQPGVFRMAREVSIGRTSEGGQLV